MRNNGKHRKIIVFTCNWHAYSSLEAVGISGDNLTSNLVPIRISCLGRITPGLILKAFEGGAGGVCLAGCPEGSCRYQNGNLEAEKVFLESKELIRLLGFDERALVYTQLPAGDGTAFIEELEELSKITAGRGKKA